MNQALFRFVAISPPVFPEFNSPGIFDASDLIAKVSEIAGLSNSSPANRSLQARQYIADGKLLDLTQSESKALLSLASLFQGGQVPTETDFSQAVTQALGQSPTSLQGDKDYGALRQGMLIGLLISRLAPKQMNSTKRSAYIVGARLCRLIDAVAHAAPDRNQMLRMPWLQMICFTRVLPPPTVTPPKRPTERKPAQVSKTLQTELQVLSSARAELRAVRSRVLPSLLIKRNSEELEC